MPGCQQNFFLTKETREQGHACNGQTGDQERDMGNGHRLSETSHVFHFIAVNIMYHGTGTQEEQGLEHGVGEEMEHGNIMKPIWLMVE